MEKYVYQFWGSNSLLKQSYDQKTSKFTNSTLFAWSTVHIVLFSLKVCQCPAGHRQKVGSVYSLDWTTGLDYWTGILDSPLTSKIVYTMFNLVHVSAQECAD